MANVPKFRQLAPETSAQRLALARVDASAIAQAQAATAQMTSGGAAKDIRGRVIRVRAVDVRAILEGKRFRFIQSEAHYLNAARGVVPDVTIKAGAEAVVAHSQSRVAALDRALRNGEIGLSEWGTAMQSAVKDAQIAQAALARGGFGNLPPPVRERIEKRIFEQFNGGAKFPGLRAFQEDIARGRYGTGQLGNGATARALQYPASGRIAYENEFAEAKREAGFGEVCRILAAVKHCESCAMEAAKGFVPEEEAVDLGNDDCGGSCHCSTVWRRVGQGMGAAAEAAIERAKGEVERIRQERKEAG